MPEVKGCGHVILAAAHRSYMKGVHLNRKLKYTEKAGVVAGQLLHHNRYYSECYNRDIQV